MARWRTSGGGRIATSSARSLDILGVGSWALAVDSVIVLPVMTRRAFLLILLLLLGVGRVTSQAPAPPVGTVAYRISLPEPEHRWMQVDVTFPNLPAAPLQLRMSRSSPGRYALHEFAKNVFDVRVTDAAGAALAVTRPNPHQWDVPTHAGTVRVTYRIFGDRIDGTYLAVDSTHAHINMPA